MHINSYNYYNTPRAQFQDTNVAKIALVFCGFCTNSRGIIGKHGDRTGEIIENVDFFAFFCKYGLNSRGACAKIKVELL